jgi:DNA polymerase I-like protein with 3'-5' exonuclease and polymerase domains
MLDLLHPPGLLQERTYTLCNTPKRLQWLFAQLGSAPECAVDIETNHPTREGVRLPPGEEPRVVGVSFSWAPKTAAYLPLYDGNGHTTFWRDGAVFETVVRRLVGWLEGPVPKIMQNGKFDTQWLYRGFGARTQNFTFDTMLAHHLLDEEGVLTCRHGLKPMAAYYLDPRARAFEESLKQSLDYYDPSQRRYSSVPMEILFPYACSDADYTLQLKQIFAPQLAAQGLTWLFENMTMPLQLTCMMSEVVGLTIDEAKVEELSAWYTERQNELTQQIWQQAGRPFDIQSTVQLSALLYEELKLPVQKDKYGKITTSKMALERLKSQHPIIPLLQEIRGINTQKQTFVDGVRSRMNTQTKKLHPTFLIHGTKTGRIATVDPNSQNMPTPIKGGIRIKSMFVAKPGSWLILSDYSQIELRVAAHLAQIKAWIRAFANNEDLHSATAKAVFKLDCDVNDVKTLHESLRRDAKTVNFGILYGQAVQGLARALDIPLEEAQALIDRYFEGLPELKVWMDQVVAFALENGYVQNPFGRRRRVPDIQLHVPAREPKPRGAPSCYGRKREAPLPVVGALNKAGIDVIKEPVVLHDTGKLHLMVKQTHQPLFDKCQVCPYIGGCLYDAERGRREFLVAELKRQIINFMVQSTATADLAGMAHAKVVREARRHGIPIALGPDQKGLVPVNIVHDELIHQVDDEYVGAAARLIGDVMRSIWPECSVALEIDQEIVRRWSDKHEKGKAKHADDFEVPEELRAGLPSVAEHDGVLELSDESDGFDSEVALALHDLAIAS